ncbi:MAG: nucleotidyl transferase AbiEii/AbiGii toxin family protein [Vulcanimicrobiaceae bacterium]
MLYRVATPEEVRSYVEVLYPLQDRILAIAGGYGDTLVLTGGTALARCYFNHRYSDDLDFFSASPHAGDLGRDLLNALERAGLSIEPLAMTPGFVRAFVADGRVRIPIDIAPDQPRIEPAVPSGLGIFVHTLRDIGANKIGAFENRSEVKDAVDLFHLASRLGWSQLFADAERKRVPIAYEDLRHFLEQPLSGEALLTQPLAPTPSRPSLQRCAVKSRQRSKKSH